METTSASKGVTAGVNSRFYDLCFRLGSYLKRHGLRRTVTQAATVARRGLLQSRKCLFCCDLRSVGASALLSSQSVERIEGAEQLGEQDWQRIGIAWNLELARRDFPERFERGATMWMVRVGGQFAGYAWTLAGDTMSPYYYPLGNGDVHLFDVFVFPAYRGRQASVYLINEILRELAAAGQARAFVETSEWNHPMLHSLYKTDFRLYAVARKLTLFGRTFVEWGNRGEIRRFSSRGEKERRINPRRGSRVVAR